MGLSIDTLANRLSRDVLEAPLAELNRLVREAGSPCAAACGRLSFPWRNHPVDFDPDLKACSLACMQRANESAARDRKEGFA